MRRYFILTAAAFGLALVGTLSAPGYAVFTSIQTVTVSAQATVVGSTIPVATITIVAPNLPGSGGSQVFFGKMLVIPIIVTTSIPLRPGELQVNIIYQLYDVNGKAIGTSTIAPVPLQSQPGNAYGLAGTAVVNRDVLTGISNGGSLQYSFSATQAGQTTVLGQKGLQRVPAAAGASAAQANAFQLSVITSLSQAVSPDGSLVSLPDTDVPDGTTAINFPRQALSAPGTLTVQQPNPATVPSGPRGLAPAVMYSMSLAGTSLVRTAQLTLSYPADLTGNVLDTTFSGTSLAPYWLNGSRWELLSLPQLDATLHTVSATLTGTQLSSQETTFALFPIGALGPSDLRPPQRIITPNGDGINDNATFSGLASSDQVHIFDVRGRRVRTIPGPTAVWDGRDDDGTIVESGVYIYQYSTQGSRVSGVVAVAK